MSIVQQPFIVSSVEGMTPGTIESYQPAVDSPVVFRHSAGQTVGIVKRSNWTESGLLIELYDIGPRRNPTLLLLRPQECTERRIGLYSYQ